MNPPNICGFCDAADNECVGMDACEYYKMKCDGCEGNCECFNAKD